MPDRRRPISDRAMQRQPIDALGKHAAELIVKRVTSGNKAEYETISLEMSLCLRGSVRKL